MELIEFRIWLMYVVNIKLQLSGQIFFNSTHIWFKSIYTSHLFDVQID